MNESKMAMNKPTIIFFLMQYQYQNDLAWNLMMLSRQIWLWKAMKSGQLSSCWASLLQDYYPAILTLTKITPAFLDIEDILRGHILSIVEGEGMDCSVCMWAPVCVPAVPLLIWLSVNMPGKQAQDCRYLGCCHPCGGPKFCFRLLDLISTSLAVTAIWSVNQQYTPISLLLPPPSSLPPSLLPSFSFQINVL